MPLFRSQTASGNLSVPDAIPQHKPWLTRSVGRLHTRGRLPAACTEPCKALSSRPEWPASNRKKAFRGDSRWQVSTFRFPASTPIQRVEHHCQQSFQHEHHGLQIQTTNFSDLFYQQVGSDRVRADPIQVGSGVQVAPTTANFTRDHLTPAAPPPPTWPSMAMASLSSMAAAPTCSPATAPSRRTPTATWSPPMAWRHGISGGQWRRQHQWPLGGHQYSRHRPGAAAAGDHHLRHDRQPRLLGGVGATVPGQVQVFDSLGNSYEATVTYTKTGTNQWSYSVSLPDTMTPVKYRAEISTTTSAPAAPRSPQSNPATNLTLTGLTAGGATATITAPTVTSGETVTQYATALTNALTAAGITGVTGHCHGRRPAFHRRRQHHLIRKRDSGSGRIGQRNRNPDIRFQRQPGQPRGQRHRHLLRRALRRRSHHEHDLERSGLKRQADHQPGRRHLHHLGHHAERLTPAAPIRASPSAPTAPCPLPTPTARRRPSASWRSPT